MVYIEFRGLSRLLDSKSLTSIVGNAILTRDFSNIYMNISTIAKFGAIAQLGERLHGMQEVRSSILLSSTNIFT